MNAIILGLDKQMISSSEESTLKINVLRFLIVCLSFGLFSNTLDHDYAWDDRIVITENPYVQNGLDGLPKIWVKQRSDQLHDQIGYRPVPLTTFALEQQWSPNNPKVGHWVNVLLYVLLCLLVVQFLYKVVGINNLFLLGFVAVIFTVHPLHAEVVANIKSRDELLQFLFSLLSVFFFHRWLQSRSAIALVVSIAALLLGVFSKENALTSVGLMVLVVLFRHRSQKVQFDWKQLLPVFVVFTAVGIGAVVYGLTSGTEIKQTEGTEVVYESPILGDCFRQLDDPLQLFMNRNLLLARYVKKFLFPTDLAYHSGFDQIPMYSSFSLPTIIGMLFSCLLLFGLAVAYRENLLVFFGIGFFLITIAPFLHLYRPMPDTIADRFAFAASLGLSIMMVSILFQLWNMEWWRKTVVVGLSVFVVFLSYATWQRNLVWKNNLTLFSSDMPKLENCAKAHEYLADALHDKFTRTNDKALIPQIVQHYERSVAISDLSYYSFLKLGSNYADWGNAERGVEVLEESVRLYPDNADPHFYLGEAYFKNGQFADAITELQCSIEISSGVYDAHYLLGRSFLELNQIEKCVSVIRKAMVKFPDQVLLRDVLVDAQLAMGEQQLAFENLDTILIQQPLNPLFWKKAIGLRQQFGLTNEADSIYRHALSNGVRFN